MKTAKYCYHRQLVLHLNEILISSLLRIFFSEVSYKLISAGFSQHQLSRGLILNLQSCTDREERGIILIKSWYVMILTRPYLGFGFQIVIRVKGVCWFHDVIIKVVLLVPSLQCFVWGKVMIVLSVLNFK